MSKIEKALQWMIDTANNDKHGYDQRYRWGERGDYDCSSAIITALQNAGIPVKEKGATYTGNMLGAFLNTGFKDVTNLCNLKTGSNLQRGDVLLAIGHHTAMYIGNGKLVHASISETGRAIANTPGDQTGKEFYVKEYYNYPWTNVLRYTEKQNKVFQKTPLDYLRVAYAVCKGEYGNGEIRVKKLKESGFEDVKTVQKIVNLACTNNASSRNIEIAIKAMNGELGNGEERLKNVTKLGFNFNLIQNLINVAYRRG